MKKYEHPQIKSVKFDVEDILTSSSADIDGGRVSFLNSWTQADIDGKSTEFKDTWGW